MADSPDAAAKSALSAARDGGPVRAPAPGLHAPVHNPTVLGRYEGVAVALRLMQLREDPVRPATFDVPHLREINRRLYQDVHASAGQFSEITRIKLDMPRQYFADESQADLVSRRFQELRAGVFKPGINKEQFIAAMADGFVFMEEWQPFQRGNAATTRAFMSEMAQHAGYDFDVSRVHPRRWSEASFWIRSGGFLKPGTEAYEEASVDDTRQLRWILRDVARPLRAAAFDRALRSGDRTAAIREHPELQPVFQGLDTQYQRWRAQVADDQDRGLRFKYGQLRRSVQRDLDEGLDPQKIAQLRLRQLNRGREQDR